MEYKNATGIPDEICNAILNSEYDGVPGSLSASQMNNPIRQTILIKRHYDKLEVDMAELIFALFGTAMHEIMHRGNKDNYQVLAEKRLNVEINGMIVSGKFDSFNYMKEELIDYKTTTVYKVQKSDFSDWENQLNIYVYLLRAHGFTVNKAKVIAIMRDWKKTQSVYSQDYPRSAVHEQPVTLKSFEEMEKIIKDKVELYKQQMNLPDKDLLHCTDQECWAGPTKYAVMKVGSKGRAIKLFDDLTEAQQFAMSNPSYVIEERKGEFLRCEYFCSAQKFCSQYLSRKLEAVDIDSNVILAGLFGPDGNIK